ncbi:ATP synthase F0 subcomplex C subunit [Mycoplasmopsis agassizii]|nr:F0F1 ATP synthase subunit C [Mycoplasmopsis agassizii]SMC17434.1 ATP synthase F0 subcomplex C subunit [Mycoplasmopsis agassizii]
MDVISNMAPVSRVVDKILETSATANSQGAGIAAGLVAVGAGLAMIGVLGTGVGQGVSAGYASQAVGRNPEAASQIRSMLIIGMAIAESSALYAFIISILLVFVY